MSSDYDKWNNVKKRIGESQHKPPFFNEGDVWWVCVGYNVGYEVYGKNKNFVRPVLIIKKFNKDFFLGIPLSTKIKKNNKYYLNISLNNRNISILLSQIRAFSSKRIENKLGELDNQDLEKVIEKVQEIFVLPPSISRGSRG